MSSDNIFLVRANVSRRRYMEDKDKTFDDIRLVKAASEDVAVEKYYKYWEDKNSAYDVSYYVRIEDISGMIE